MGIRFHCPQCGRRLNVKDSLADKKGICPHCNAKILIPRASSDDAASASDGSAAGSIPGSISPVVATAAAGATATSVPGEVEARWFVMPPGGTSQYGPASEAEVLAWIHEGRVVADSMLRRIDWTAWQPAASVFPELGKGGAVAVPATPFPAPATPPIPVPAPSPATAIGASPAVMAIPAPVLPTATPIADSAFGGPTIAVLDPAGVGPRMPDTASQRPRMPVHSRSNRGPIIAIVILLVALVPLTVLAIKVIQDQFSTPESPAPGVANGQR